MLSLTPSAKAIFNTRNATIVPVLTIYDEAGTATVIDPSNIFKRPKRQSFPIGAYGITASPVMRCDISLAPTPAIRALFIEKRRVVCQEIVNGQTFARFDGHIDKLDKGWAVDPATSALVDSLMVFCFSWTQILKDYEDETFTFAQTVPAADLAMTPIIRANLRTWVMHGTGLSVDAMPGTAAGGSYNIMDAHDPSYTYATWYSAANVQSTAYAGTDFTITLGALNLYINWLTTNRPPDNQEYYLQYKTVLGFVAARLSATVTAATNAAPISITATGHGFAAGDAVSITGVTGNTAANGTNVITVVNANTFTLNGTTGNGAYVSGGVASKAATYTDPVTPATTTPYIFQQDFGFASVARPVESCDPIGDFAFIRNYAVYQCSPVVYTRSGLSTGTSGRDKDTDWNFNPVNGILYYIGPGKLFSSATAPRGYEMMFVGLKNCKIADTAYAPNDIGRRVSDLYYRAGIVNDSARFNVSGVTATDIAVRAMGDAVLANLNASSPPNYIVADDTDGLPRGKFVTQKTTPDFTLSTITALKNQEPQTIATRYYCYNTVTLVQGVAGDATTMDYANRTADGQPNTFATIKAGNAGGSVFIPNSPQQRIKQIKVRFEGELTLLNVSDTHSPDYGIPIPAAFTRIAHQTAEAGNEIIITGFDNYPMRPGSFRTVRIALGPLGGVTTPKLYTVEVTYDYDFYGQAFITNDPALSGSTGWVDAGNADLTTLVKYVDPNQVARWMVKPLVVAASTTADPFYTSYWAHKTIKVNVPGVTNSRTLRTLASQYLADALKHSTTQKATVVMEPLAEIGDTVQVIDMSSGTTYNRTIVGIEDADSWDTPSQTFDLADFS